MSIKNVLLILFIGLSFKSAFSQAREDSQKFVPIEKSAALSNATGWIKNTASGKWISNQNAIAPVKLSGFTDTSQVDNFKWMYIQSFDVHYPRVTSRYYAIVYEVVTGNWKYPVIKQDWQAGLETKIFIITKDDYKKVQKALIAKNARSITIVSPWTGSVIGKYPDNAGEYDQMIWDNIVKINDSQSTNGKSMAINFQVLEGKNIARFVLPQPTEYDTKAMLNEMYYETNLDDIAGLFSLQ